MVSSLLEPPVETLIFAIFGGGGPSTEDVIKDEFKKMKEFTQKEFAKQRKFIKDQFDEQN